MNISEITAPDKIWTIKKESSRHAYLAAHSVNRKPMAVKEFYNHPELIGWIYNHTRDQMKMDPWTQIEGVDASIDWKEYYLDYGISGHKKVGPDFVVWVQ